MPPNSPSQSLQAGREVLPPFETLYDRYYVQVYRYLHTHLKDEHEAADLLQQVFFQAWSQRESYKPERGSVATWLFSIAHHRLVDFYRLSRSSLSWESISEIPTTDQDPETHVIESETIAEVRKLLAALSRSEQELLALRFAARLSSAEIASVIGKSEAATKKQLTRLIQRLREQYRRQELEETPIPELLDPALPMFTSALRQAYAGPLPAGRLQNIRHSLLKQAYRVAS